MQNLSTCFESRRRTPATLLSKLPALLALANIAMKLKVHMHPVGVESDQDDTDHLELQQALAMSLEGHSQAGADHLP